MFYFCGKAHARIAAKTAITCATVLIGMMLSSCHNAHGTLSSMPVFYTDDASVELINIKKNKVSIDAPQHIEGAYGEKTFSMDAWMRMNDSLLNIVLFSGFGNTVAELKFTSDSLKFESSVMNAEKTKAEYIVADIELCYFDMAVLKPHYEASQFSLTETINENESKRTLSKGGKEILTITNNGSTIQLKNILRNYSYTITTGSAQ